MTKKFRERLNDLAVTIEQRQEPLGVGLKRQCWAGVAHGIAASHGERLTDYFGISAGWMKSAIKENNQTAPGDRNRTMASRTSSLSASL